LEFLGRIDHQVKIRGFRIELGEIETALNQHSAIKQAIVTAYEYSPGDKRLIAYWVAANGAEATTPHELRQFLKQTLPSYMIPAAFAQLEALPLMPNGKVDRRALPQPHLSDIQSSSDYVAPRTPLEQSLVDIWAQVLKLEQVGIHDNFFELGGDSLLATQVLTRTHRQCKIEFSLHRLFEAPTIAQICASLGPTLVQSKQPLPDIHRHQEAQLTPLSFSQQRLWFLQQLEPESQVAYHLTYTLRLRGVLHREALQRALTTILERHEILRTGFVTTDGIPHQVITPAGKFDLSLIDLRTKAPEQLDAMLLSLLEQGAQQPFDLTSDPMLRATLVCCGETEHVLQMVMHHVAFDDWSMGILTRELSILYQAYVNGQPNSLPELPIQYADFAQWQRQWLTGDALDTQLSYWKQHLSGASTVLPLPTDHPRPPQPSYRGGQLPFIVSPSLTNALKQLSQQTGSTLFMTLLAAFNTLLHRYTQQEDIVVGCPIANRNRVEIEPLIGFFVNTLALRTDLSGYPSFQELLKRVRQATLEAYTHQDLPFEKLVEELQPDRSLSHSPLFQVMFVLQNAPRSPLELTGISIESMPFEPGTAKFDLTLSMSQEADGLRGVFEYSTDLFDAATIQRMIGHFQTLLQGIVANPEQSIMTLPLLTEAESHQLLVEWNQTETNYPQDKSIHQLFEEQVERTPDAIAVVFEGEALTYRELNHRANQLAHYLHSLGVGLEQRVGICVERSIKMVVGMLAVLKAGGAYVPIDPNHPIERIAYVLTDAQFQVLLTEADLAGRLPSSNIKLVLVDEHSHDWEGQVNHNLVPLSTTNHLAYVIYTSGSTGNPKGVQIRHCSVVNFLGSMIQKPGIQSEDIVLAITTLSFDIAVLEIWGALSVGARVVIASREVASDGYRLIQTLHDYRITLLQATPATWQILFAANWRGTPRLKMLCGGEALTKDLAHQLLLKGAELWNMYGPTETTVWSLVGRVLTTESAPSMGRPIANTQIYVLDPNLQPVPIGIPGELHIGGEGLAQGYLNRPELTEEKFIPNPFDHPKSKIQNPKLYKTGDLVRYLPDGNIEFLGRIDNQVKIRGFRIELGEIEAILSQHPAVTQTVVVDRKDASDNKRLIAYFVTNNLSLIQDPKFRIQSQLREFLKQKLPDYMIPLAFVLLETLPLTPNGKVDRRALPVPDQIRVKPEATFVAPRDELEIQLVKIWEKVLNIQPIGIHDNFFELGGNSLLAVQIFAQIEEQFNRKIPLATLFQEGTIYKLSHLLADSHWQGSWNSLVAIQPKGTRPPFFCVHGHGGQVLYFHQLAHCLGEDQPFYALQPQGLDGQQTTLHRIEEMASHYLQEIRRIQPTGPYFIGGHSFGGIVAYEMAQQLCNQGQKVALLVLIDSYRLKLLSSPLRYFRHIRNLFQLEFQEQLAYLQKRMANFQKKVSHQSEEEGESLQLINDQAYDNYQMYPYSGRSVLFKASDKQLPESLRHLSSLSETIDDQLGWGQLFPRGLEVQEVPGDHNTILDEPNVRQLAEGMKACIDRAMIE
ncbi:MAG: amino acid adenylation domain-containing protein, partial [Leptolyngbyaceae cyanobacterium]